MKRYLIILSLFIGIAASAQYPSVPPKTDKSLKSTSTYTKEPCDEEGGTSIDLGGITPIVESGDTVGYTHISSSGVLDTFYVGGSNCGAILPISRTVQNINGTLIVTTQNYENECGGFSVVDTSYGVWDGLSQNSPPILGYNGANVPQLNKFQADKWQDIQNFHYQFAGASDLDLFRIDGGTTLSGNPNTVTDGAIYVGGSTGTYKVNVNGRMWLDNGNSTAIIGRNTAPLITGTNNTVMGANSVTLATTSRNITSVGASNFTSLTTGINNIGIGSFVNTSLTNESTVTSVGVLAAYQATGISEGVFVGGGAGQNATGIRSTVIGTNAGRLSAANNTFIGYDAGRFTTTNDNTSIGWQAGRNNVGAANINIGTQAGINGTGLRAISIGRSAGEVNEAAYNLFIGDVAGTDNTTGIENTFVGGNNTGLSNITGSSNTLIGNSAGRSLLNKDNNTVVGAGAQQDNNVEATTGIGRGANGSNAADSVTSVGFRAGSNNLSPRSTFIGTISGVDHDAASSDNTAIGYNSFAIANGLKNSTAIGANSQPLKSNQIVLGDGNVEEVITNGDIISDQGVLVLRDTVTGILMKIEITNGVIVISAY